MADIPSRQIRAVYDNDTIRVYQAYRDDIADTALANGTFVSPPCSMTRMTWIKPSFLWMMYRAGWGFKDEGQKRILAIDITREGFEWALANSSLSHVPTSKDAPPVRVQWDPERDIFHRPLANRSIQIGLGPHAVPLYVRNWIRKISDLTATAHRIRDLVVKGDLEAAQAGLLRENPYPVSAELRRHLEMDLSAHD